MSNEKTAESWLRVSELREQKTQMDVARAQAELLEAKESLDASELRLERSQQVMRAQTTDVVSVANMELLSRGLAADEAAVARSRTHVQKAQARLREVIEVHSETSKQRMVAERYRDRLRRERIDDWQRKQDREASDRAGRAVEE
jgi:hypothetical protein